MKYIVIGIISKCLEWWGVKRWGVKGWGVKGWVLQRDWSFMPRLK
jgi:hypothetical protein